MYASGASRAAGHRRAAPVSAKVLAETLQSMQRDGFVRRHQVTGAPDRAVEYELSELGRSLLPVIDRARLWGRAHLGELDSHRNDDDHASHASKPGSDAAIADLRPADSCQDR